MQQSHKVIAVAAANSNRVYVGTSASRLYRSDDGGHTNPWMDKTGALPGKGIQSIWVDPANADVVMVSCAGISSGSAQAVYRSANGGTNWTDLSGNLPSVQGNSVVGDPNDAATFYLATDGGVYRTTDGGVHWLPFDNGIPNAPVSDLTIDLASNMLYVATMGRGAYKLDITPGVMKQPVDFYLRDDDLDTGERLPSPSGLPDPLVPSPATAVWWTSQDIKINHTPYFTPTGVFDGVDFDTHALAPGSHPRPDQPLLSPGSQSWLAGHDQRQRSSLCCRRYTGTAAAAQCPGGAQFRSQQHCGVDARWTGTNHCVTATEPPGHRILGFCPADQQRNSYLLPCRGVFDGRSVQ